jgi:hypothetical protein
VSAKTLYMDREAYVDGLSEGFDDGDVDGMADVDVLVVFGRGFAGPIPPASTPTEVMTPCIDQESTKTSLACPHTAP